MNTPKGDNESALKTPLKPGFHFAIPAALPGLLGAGFIAVQGMSVSAAVAAAASAVFSAKKLPYATQYSLTKQLTGIFAGAAIGGTAMYGAAVNAPEVREPAEKAEPVSMLHMEQRGGSLSRDFTQTENAVATATVENGRTVYKLTAPKATY